MALADSRERFGSTWYARPGLVYFLGAGDPPVAVKIGVTQRDRLAQRIRAIQCSNHETIKLLGAISFSEGQKPLLEAERHEQELHRQFAKFRRGKDGTAGHEWFDAAPELVSFIKTLG